jgi:hypothetical protein
MFHFLTDPADRATYLQTLRAALADGGGITAGMVTGLGWGCGAFSVRPVRVAAERSFAWLP